MSISTRGAAAFCAFAAAALALAERPLPNSFIDYPAPTIQVLIREVSHDPHVADRYERHFAMTKRRLIQLLQMLHRSRLKQDGIYQVFSVPPDGHVKMHFEKLKRGERIYANSKGMPVLLVKCGNPVVPGSSAGTRVPQPETLTPLVRRKPVPERESVQPIASAMTMQPESPSPLVATPQPPPAETVFATLSEPEPTILGTGSGSPINLVPIVGAIGIVGLLADPPVDPPQPTPEPNTALIVLIVPALMFQKQRKHRAA